MKRLTFLVICLVLFPALLTTAQDILKLPCPHLQQTMSFEEVMNKIQTEKTYGHRTLRISDLSYVLWAAAGNRFGTDAVNGATRTYPSAGGVYFVRLYVLIGDVEGVRPGIYQYVQDDHSLKQLKEGD